MKDDERPEPESFLHLVEQVQKGRLKIVYDFNPDNQASGSTLFGPCLDLADYLLTVPDVTTIAFVHAQVNRHTVLPVLACQEIVIAPGLEAANTLVNRGKRADDQDGRLDPLVAQGRNDRKTVLSVKHPVKD